MRRECSSFVYMVEHIVICYFLLLRLCPVCTRSSIAWAELSCHLPLSAMSRFKPVIEYEQWLTLPMVNIMFHWWKCVNSSWSTLYVFQKKIRVNSAELFCNHVTKNYWLHRPKNRYLKFFKSVCSVYNCTN